MLSCEDCKYFRVYYGSKDKYGVPQEPDDYECVGEPSDEDIDKYFTDSEEWDSSEDGCSGFAMREDDYEY